MSDVADFHGSFHTIWERKDSPDHPREKKLTGDFLVSCH